MLSASNGSDQTWTSGRRRQGQSINGVKANEQMGEERVDMDMDLDSPRWVGMVMGNGVCVARPGPVVTEMSYNHVRDIGRNFYYIHP